MPKIQVKSKPASFRRAGLSFDRNGRVLDTADLTKEQLKALADEPNLSVTEIADEGDSKAAKKAAEKAAAEQAAAEKAAAEKAAAEQAATEKAAAEKVATEKAPAGNSAAKKSTGTKAK